MWLRESSGWAGIGTITDTTSNRGSVPPPRLHRHRYHGAFAPNAAWRKQVVRYGRDDAEDTDASALAPVDGSDPCRHTPDPSPSAARARSRWAQLLARVYEIDPLRCPAGHRREALVVGR